MKLRETGSDNAKPKKNPEQLKAEEQHETLDEFERSQTLGSSQERSQQKDPSI
tara:strand:+ start:121 stop:279 length:159 start_codon:yes stop_codon:yes gene_type:complete